MKSQDIITKYLNNSISLKIDYNDIKSRVNLNLNKDKKYKPHSRLFKYRLKIMMGSKKVKYILRFSISIIIIGLITMSSILIYNSANKQAIRGTIKPGKSNIFINNYFDKTDDIFFAYGPKYFDLKYNNVEVDSIKAAYTDTIISTPFLSESDKRILDKYRRNTIRYLNNTFDGITRPDGYIYFKIYLANRDGNDVVLLQSCNASPYGTLLEFNSNLDYSFIDIIHEFEDMIDSELTQEYLREENAGIYVDFKIDGDLYIPFYILEYDGVTYTIEK